jgi:hypothetical protein
MVKVFLVISLVTFLALGSSPPAGADTYGLSSNDPVLNFEGTISVTDANQTRGIDYSGTGTVKNYGDITTVTTGGAGISLGIYYQLASPSGEIGNSGNITASSVANSAAANTIYAPLGINAVTNDGRITANAIGTADAASCGIYALNAVVTNNGTIAASASGSGGTVVQGVYNFLSGGLINNGTISASGNSTGGNVSVFAAITSGGGQTVNSGTLSATGSGSGTIESYALVAGNGPTINSGAIAASASSTGAVSRAWGILGNVGSINNNGNISASATGVTGTTASAYGIYTNGNVINSGNVSATADSDICKVSSITSTVSGVTNTGNVTTVANSITEGEAYGIVSIGAVSNSGNITVTAHGGLSNKSNGIYAIDSITNSGNISVTADTTRGGVISSVARGIFANGVAVNVNNDGRITVHAQGVTAYSFGIYSIAGAAVNNSGEIIVSAVGSTSVAYGITYGVGGILTNTGVILAGDDNAYEVYVAAGTVNLLNRYNMTLDGNPAKGSLLLNAGSAINLNGSEFSVTAAPDTRFYTRYRIFYGTGTVNGAFGSVAPAQNPAVSVLYHDQGTAGSVDDTVSLSYHPRTSPFLEGINVNRYLLYASLAPVQQQQVNGFLNSLLPGPPIQLAANDTVASDAPGSLVKSIPDENVYVIPYYAYLDKDSNRLGYEVNSTGFTAGYEKRFGWTQLGFHLGYGFADVDFKGSDFPKSTEDQQKIFSLGIQGMTRWGNWTLRGDLTGFYDHHDYEGVSGVNFEAHEKADYDSLGTTENLLGGYAFKAGPNVFLPEIGLNHTWVRQEGFKTSASFGGWETENSSVDNNLFQALASVRWLSRFSLREIPCTTSLTLGGRYRLNNDDLSVQQSVPGSSPVMVTSDQDRAAATASFSLALRKGNISSELAYSGDYSDDNIMHAVWFKFAYAF